jgi:hypothetical protein
MDIGAAPIISSSALDAPAMRSVSVPPRSPIMPRPAFDGPGRRGVPLNGWLCANSAFATSRFKRLSTAVASERWEHARRWLCRREPEMVAEFSERHADRRPPLPHPGGGR